MESSLAILMADLSGYTALTEVHGAGAAMQLIGKYMELAGRSLVGNSRLVERTGDQLVIISEDADSLASTAISLIRHAKEEPRFLHVHAGLHYGTVTEQQGHYYGSAVNLTARIASNAKAGKIYCSREFVEALTTPEVFQLEPLGTVRFKNVLVPKEIYELLPEIHTEWIAHIDPVCHMQLHGSHHPISHTYNGKDYFFCSEECRQLFVQHEQVYTEAKIL